MSETWEELEAPVLRWVLEHGREGTGQLWHDSSEPFAGIPELTQAQVADAIKRLQQYGLVASEKPTATNAYESWHQLRPSADGLRVLGEWPPAQGAAVNVALARILRALADSDEVSEEERTAARRAQERYPRWPEISSWTSPRRRCESWPEAADESVERARRTRAEMARREPAACEFPHHKLAE